MAIVNRYTQTQENKYTPRTLQELMVAPAYKRQKHDELDAGIAQYESQLAQTTGMDVHSKLLEEQQQELYNRMLAQRDKLDSEGFSQSAKSDFMRFNKDYQQAIGPQGSIGKIQQAKNSFDNYRKEVLAIAMKQGHNVKATQDRIKEQKEIYKKEFEKTGEVKDFNGILPPSYHDLDRDIKSTKSTLGHVIETNLPKGEPYKVEVNMDTGRPLIQITSKSGVELTKKNSEALKEANDYLTNKWLTKGGEGYESAMWNGMDLKIIENAIKSGLGMMNVDESKDTRKEDVRFMDSPSTTTKKTKEPDNTRRLVSSPSTSKSIPEEVTNITEAEEQVAAYEAAGNTTKASRLETRIKNIEREYQNESPEVTLSKNNAQAEIEEAYQNLKISMGGNFDIVYDLAGAGATVQGYNMANNADKFVDLAINNSLLYRTEEDSNGNTIHVLREDGPLMDNPTLIKGGEEIKAFYDTVTKDAKLIRAYKTGLNNKIAHEKNQNIKFNVEVFDTESDRTEYNNTMASIVKNHMNSFQTGVVLTRDEGSNEEEDQLTDSDSLKDAKSLIANTPISQIGFRGFIMQTENGIPAIEVEVHTGKESELGEGKVVIAQLELPKLTTDNTSIQGANNAILETLKRYGGAEAYALDNKLKQSIVYKDLYPTFNNDNFKQSSKIKQSLPYKDPDKVNAPNQVGDVLKANGILQNDIDISTQIFDGETKYTIKHGGSEWVNGEKITEVNNIKWGDLLVNNDLQSAPPNVWRHIIGRIPAFLEQQGYTDIDQITNEDEEIFVDILKDTDIMVDNYYDLLDILNGQ